MITQQNDEKGIYVSLSDKVYQCLRDRIAGGYYHTGDTLIETQVASELNVSRTPVREALKQLELEDLVSSHPNRGVIVKGFTEQDYDDAFAIRCLLEGQAAFWAAERISELQLQELANVVDLMEFYTARKDAARLVQLDNQFHEIVYQASASRTILHIMPSLHHSILSARHSSLTDPNRAEESLQEHRNILEALSLHDAALAKSRMESHVETAGFHTHRR